MARNGRNVVVVVQLYKVCTTPSRSDFPCESNPTKSFVREVASCRATTRTMRRGPSAATAQPPFTNPLLHCAHTPTRAKPSLCVLPVSTHSGYTLLHKSHRRHRPRSYFLCNTQQQRRPNDPLPAPTNPPTDIFNNNKQALL